MTSRSQIIRNFIAFLLAAWASTPAQGQCDPPQIQKLVSPGGAGAQFGRWVDIDGDFAAVAGTVASGELGYVYERDNGGTPSLLTDDTWTQVASLNSPAGPATGIAIHGNTVVMSTAASLLVFEAVGGWQGMISTAILTNGSLAFRQDVAITDDLIVGANDLGTGRVAIFLRPMGGWTNASTPSAELMGSGGTLLTYLGMDGDTIVVQATDSSPAAYVYVKPPGGWSGTIPQSARLAPLGPPGSACFGAGIAVDGDVVLVADVCGGPVYVFQEPTTGWSGAGTVMEVAQLTPTQGAASLSRFGESPALEGDLALAGSNNDMAFFYERDGATWTSMTETAVITPADVSSGDQFGYRNRIRQGTALIGAPNDDSKGSAYLFALNTCDLIQQHPTSLARCEGEEAVFSVVAMGTGTLGYQWRKGGDDLMDGGTVSGTTTDTLTISAVSTMPDDSGEYDVVVTDSAGPVQISEKAVLAVSALPVLSGPLDQAVDPGSMAAFTVSVSAPASSFTFVWLDPDDMVLSSGGNYIIDSTATTSTLTLVSAEPADDGVYTVMVTDDASGCSSSATASLTTDDLQITSPLDPVTPACDGAPGIFLEVMAMASGPPTMLTFQWFKDDAAITSNPHLQIASTDTSSRLTIDEVVPGDVGTYRVEVTHLGTLSSSSQLVLVPAPAILQEPINTGFCPGDPPVQLFVGVQAAEPVTYQWRRNGIPLVASGNTSIQSNGSGSTLQITNPVGDQFASYEVTVTDGCMRTAVSSKADLFRGHRRITGYAAGSIKQGPTTGGDTITLRGNGLESGMVVGFRSPVFEVPADPLDVNEVPGSNGTLLEVIVPPFPPGCDCANGQAIRTTILIDDDCGTGLVSTERAFHYEIAQVLVSDPNGVQAAIDAVSGMPGHCIVLEYTGPKGTDVFNGPLIIDSTHSATTLTSAAPLGFIQVSSNTGFPPTLPSIRLDQTGYGVCVSNLSFVSGRLGMDIVGASPIVRSCQFDDNLNSSNGGGISIRGLLSDPCATHPILVDCTVFANVTTGSGGGIHLEHCGATIAYCDIHGNSASGRGGGIYIEDNCPDLLITESEIQGHPSSPFPMFPPTPSINGGGIYWTAGMAPTQSIPLAGLLLRNEVEGNTSMGNGAGVFLDARLAPKIIGNTIVANEASTTSSKGGGIYLEHALGIFGTVFPICENVIARNAAQIGGAFAILNKQQPLFERNLVYCNQAKQLADPEDPEPPESKAAGIFVLDAGPIVRHNTIYFNTGVDGLSPEQQSGGIHGESIGFGNESFTKNLLVENEGREFYADALPSPVVSGNLAYDPGDPWQLLFAEGDPLGPDNVEGLDPLLLNPDCNSTDPWTDFDVDDLSPLAADGTFRGAIPMHPFELGACVPAVSGDCNENGIPDRVELLAGVGIDSNGNGVLDECEATFFADLEALPAAMGGQVSFFLNPGAEYAGDRFLVLGSMSGTAPGIDIRSVHVPLNPDAYYRAAWVSAAGASGSRLSGALNGQGQGTALLVLEGNLALIGTELHLAFVVMHNGGSGRPKLLSAGVVFASNAVPLRLE